MAKNTMAELKLDVSLEWHLTGNIYPPQSRALVPLCKKAIQQVHDERGEEFIPDVTLNGCKVTANEVIERYNLDWYVENDPA